MDIILHGAPGAGKKTLAKLLQFQHGFATVLIPRIVKGEVDRATRLGKKIRDCQLTGQTISDDLLFETIFEELNRVARTRSNSVLVGMPETVTQAKWLRTGSPLSLDRFVYLTVNSQVAIDRLAQRLVCPNCLETFNRIEVKNGGWCICGGRLMSVSSDGEESVKRRQQEFYARKDKILKVYEEKAVMIAADGTPRQVLNRLSTVLKLKGY